MKKPVTVMHEGVGHEVRDRELQHHSGIDCGRKRERTRSERRAAFSGCDLTDTVEFEAESRGPGSRHDTVVEEEFVRVTLQCLREEGSLTKLKLSMKARIA